MLSPFIKPNEVNLAISKRLLLGIALVLGTVVPAQSNLETNRLDEVVVEGKWGDGATVPEPFLPPIQGTRINSGKKTAVIDLNAVPEVVNHNYRQALALTPGLVLAEDVTPLLSVGYRGLNPYRSQFTQVLKDGIPITMDMFGYPEAYYTPPLEGVERIEFLHGGASLMYGPQPGGSLNYVSHRPRTDKQFAFRTQQVLGSDNLYSTYNSIDGTIDRVGYYAYFHHRQTDGFRAANSDLELFSGSAKLVLDAQTDSRWILSLDGYSEEHGEPGGLTFATGTNTVNYTQDRNAASRLFDRFRLDRGFISLAWEKDFSENTQLTLQGWGRYNYRLSRRQLGGGFGTLPSGPTATNNAIQLQEFYNSGLEGRLRHDWTWGENSHTLAGGATFYYTDSPRVDKRGATPDATEGAVQNRISREIFYAPVFVENLFKLGAFSVTPGLRLENIWQSVEEKVNVGKTAAGAPLSDRSQYDFVPLLGLGLEYELKPGVSAYANVSQAYRPKLFTEAVPLEPTSVINYDLKEGNSWQYEIGLRGHPKPYLTWDASLFLLDFEDQIGSVTLTNGLTSLENVGRAIHKGIEAAVQLDLVGVVEDLKETAYAERWGSFSLYGNMMLLDAEFVSGPQEGHAPQHAPHFLFRAGAVYRWDARIKVAMLSTFVDEQFADDNNTASFFIPGYSVWDLTLEARLHKNVSLLAGINNLFDEDYYARIRGEGIDPAYRRNYYLGLSLTF